MTNKMYVGNLPFSSGEDDLRKLFSEFGTVTESAVVMDRETARPRGFAFVSMDTRESMENAIRGLDGKELDGRKIVVNEARERDSGAGQRGGFGGSRR